jgi:hypothetical protein
MAVRSFEAADNSWMAGMFHSVVLSPRRGYRNPSRPRCHAANPARLKFRIARSTSFPPE